MNKLLRNRGAHSGCDRRNLLSVRWSTSRSLPLTASSLWQYQFRRRAHILVTLRVPQASE